MNLLTHFGQPLWLAAGAFAVAVTGLLFWRFDARQRRRMLAFSVTRATDSALYGVSRPLLWVKRAALCLGMLAACIALAHPLGALQMQQSEQRGVDILFAIDTSRSMLTPDVKPNRLERAKLAVEDLLDHLNGDGVGLIAFAGEAFLQAPVTTDYDAFRETLDALDTHTISLGGTDIASAIRLGEATLALRGDTQKVLVLITDGEDLGGDALRAAQAAAGKGLIIFTVGVGTAAGELIPFQDNAGNVQFVKDPAGHFVKSRLDSAMLMQIASATGGVYTPLGAQSQGLAQLYEARLKGFAQRQHAERQIALYAELFQWPLGAAIAFLVLEWLLGVSVRRRVPVPRALSAALVLAALSGVALVRTPPVWASPRTAQAAYDKGQYAQAQRDYAQSLKSDPTSSQLQFNLGAAAYRAHDFAAAAEAFSNALKTRDIPQQQSAYYNLGNALFRQGEKAQATDPQLTMKTWQQSLGAYDTALQLQPGDPDAKFNRDVVQRRLDELKRQQQQNQQGHNSQQNQNKQDPQHQKDPDAGNPQQRSQDHSEQQNQQNQQNQQSQQSQPSQQNPQDSQNRSAPQPAAGPTQPDSSRPEPTSPQAAAAQDIGKPNQMSAQEAEQLLDSAKGEERHLPLGTAEGKARNAGAPLRDW